MREYEIVYHSRKKEYYALQGILGTARVQYSRIVTGYSKSEVREHFKKYYDIDNEFIIEKIIWRKYKRA